MEKNIYYENLSTMFSKVSDTRYDVIWNEIYKALGKLEPDKRNKELFRQIVECFEKFKEESANDKMSLFFLSFLIKLTNNVKYFTELINLCLESTEIAANSKFYVYSYCSALMRDRYHFGVENALNELSNLFDKCINMNEKYLSRDLNNLDKAPTCDSVLLIISGFGKYPFGQIKHLLDVCSTLSAENKKISVFITHEQLFEYGKIHLYPSSAYEFDTIENTAMGISKITNLNRNIEIFEFDIKKSFISEVKQALLKISESKPYRIINFSGKNIFTELLRLGLVVCELKDIDMTEQPDVQDSVLSLSGAAQRYLEENRNAEAEKCLFQIYENLKNNKLKVKICIQLADLYLKSGQNDKALDCVRGLPWLEESSEVYDYLAHVYEILGDNKNAIFLYEKVLQRPSQPSLYDKRDYMINLNLFRLYMNENIYEKAAVCNEYLINESDPDIEFLRYRFYYASFMEKEAFRAMDVLLSMLKGLGDMRGYADKLTTAIGSLSYYEVYDDEKYIRLLEEMYRVTDATKVVAFNGYTLKDKSIRIGFISGEVARHPVGFFVASLFKNRKKNGRFKYYFYYTPKINEEDETTEHIRKGTDVYRYVGDLPDERIREIVLSDNIDILIDLNGISGAQKINILVNRLAPIQITWIGFPGSMPIKNLDYNIVDKYTDPVGIAEKFYTERLIYLPKSFLCYSLTVNSEIEAPPCLKNGYITFGSFNTANKYSDAILKIWGRLLNEIKNARLIIRTSVMEDKYILDKLIQKFEKNGIDIERTVFLPSTHRASYFLGYNDVDIILDTYPFNGATTTCDAFLMGTPVISLYGVRHASRVGLSMLSNVSLADLAVSNEDDYVKKAVELSNDAKRLEFLSKNLRDITMASPLMNDDEFKKDFEETIYKAYREGGIYSGG